MVVNYDQDRFIVWSPIYNYFVCVCVCVCVCVYVCVCVCVIYEACLFSDSDQVRSNAN